MAASVRGAAAGHGTLRNFVCDTPRGYLERILVYPLPVSIARAHLGLCLIPLGVC
ncbi:hypothetical protein STVIR_0519 [Streptomyces viridochromogenes Tue57]|uniref:Uncharacterized protein n=1 Tax=Streptomyces viridochromogenes Tue57 TaxID=1160705 RepID=L8PLU7_STRVR|nr:hypothetical protein STVIR_0519 [Streptomyces viridochromogenes Tue57]